MSMTTHKGATRQTHPQWGFTLVETLVALSLSTFIVLGVSLIFIEGLGHIRGVRAQALLTSDAGYMVQMIRNELLGADSIAVNPSNAGEVDIVQDGIVHTVALTDGRALLDGESITREGVIVSDLSFEKVGQSLRIQFMLTSGLRTNKTFIGQTTLALR